MCMQGDGGAYDQGRVPRQATEEKGTPRQLWAQLHAARVAEPARSTQGLTTPP